MAAFLFSGCAAHSSIEPIGGGNTELHVSGGYPVYPVVEVRHGIADWLEISAGAHMRPIVEGDIAGEATVTVFPFGRAPEASYKQRDWLLRPTVGVQVGYSWIDLADDEDSEYSFTRITPTLGWPTEAGVLYLGTDLGQVQIPWDELNLPFMGTWKRDPDPVLMVVPFLGHQFQLNKMFGFTIEAKVCVDPEDGAGAPMGFISLDLRI